eukprot:10763862-Ditylum_brightwellii.AAC.1
MQGASKSNLGQMLWREAKELISGVLGMQFNWSEAMPFLWEMVMEIKIIIEGKWSEFCANMLRPMEHG